MRLSYVLSTQPTRFAAVSVAQDLDASIALLAKLGYAGVELAVRDPGLLDVSAVKKALAQNQLSVSAIGTGQAFVEEGLSFTHSNAAIRESAITRIESHIAFARELGSARHQGGIPPLIIIGLIRGANGGPESIQPLQDALKRIAQTARAVNIRLAIEPINRYETSLLNTAGETLTLIKDVGADNIGVLFDTFHANIEEPSIERSLRACGSRLFHVHVADSNRWAPGMGHINFASIFATLGEMAYGGWISAEILQKPDERTAQAQAFKTIQPFLGG